MKIRSLVLKIVISMIAIDIVSISIVTVLYYLQSKDALYNRAFIQLSQVKKIKYQQLYSYFGLIYSTLTSVAENESMIKLISEQSSNNKFHNSEFFNSISITEMNTGSKVEFVNRSQERIDSATLNRLLSVKIDKPQVIELIDYDIRFVSVVEKAE